MTTVNGLFQRLKASLWSGMTTSDVYPAKRPLLAHYTSISTLDAIVSNNELWMSNPLFMNDVEELRFGMNEGLRALIYSTSIRQACSTEQRHKVFLETFQQDYQAFDQQHAFNTYIACLSEHNIKDNDGRLSMWRGYGANGNGAAIVFDSSKLNYVESSSLILAPVAYGSTEERRKWLEEKLDAVAAIIKSTIVLDEELELIAHLLFERIKFFSLFTKHDGFREEQEWRVAYMPDRDRDGRLHHLYHYAVGAHGVEPKLRFKLEAIDGITAKDFSFSKIVDRILLGPSISSSLAISAAKRMLQQNGKKELCDRVFASSTPYRSR